MPELPELEAIKRYLLDELENVRITEIQTRQHTVIRFPTAPEFKRILLNASFENVERIGRILKFKLMGESRKLCLYIDHGLTGRLGWESDYQRIPTKIVFKLRLDNGKCLIYHDSRLHGAIWLFEEFEGVICKNPPIVNHYGPDILSISEKAFLIRIKKFRAEIKNVLTNQSFVTGIGNAYSDEILFDAQIHPFTKRNQLNDQEIKRIYHSSLKILKTGSDFIFKSLKTINKLDNESSWRKNLFKVHLRENQPCHSCNKKLSTIKTKRVTNFCRECQPSKNKNFF
ncbi:MAG: hypothetical protein EAX86_09845 [Candidatus Heimdallarchaeota archaeon]|nr:hypothetical protein [Candidatus Heimdallarchaeota archaeon]